MARKYTYIHAKTGKILFETVEPNYVSMEDVDKKMAAATKRDPRLDPFIERMVRVVADTQQPLKSHRYNKNKTTRRRV